MTDAELRIVEFLMTSDMTDAELRIVEFLRTSDATPARRPPRLAARAPTFQTYVRPPSLHTGNRGRTYVSVA